MFQKIVSVFVLFVVLYLAGLFIPFGQMFWWEKSARYPSDILARQFGFENLNTYIRSFKNETDHFSEKMQDEGERKKLLKNIQKQGDHIKNQWEKYYQSLQDTRREFHETQEVVQDWFDQTSEAISKAKQLWKDAQEQVKKFSSDSDTSD